MQTDIITFLLILNQNANDIDVLVAFMCDQLSKVFCLVIGSKDEDKPFHGSSDFLAVQLLHNALFNVFQLIDGLFESTCGLLLHFSIFEC